MLPSKECNKSTWSGEATHQDEVEPMMNSKVEKEKVEMHCLHRKSLYLYVSVVNIPEGAHKG